MKHRIEVRVKNKEKVLDGRVNVNMTHSVPRCDDQNFHSVTKKPMDQSCRQLHYPSVQHFFYSQLQFGRGK